MAIKVGGTEVISDSRALNNISSVDAATVTALSDAGVGAGATLEATASGTLANGDTVIVNADGTVSVVEETRTGPLSVGSTVQFNSGTSTNPQAAFDSNSNKVVLLYGTNYRKAIVGTVSGTSISFGTAVTLDFNSSNPYLAIAFDSNTNKVVCFYNGSSGYGYASVGTVSGTSISFGSPVVFYSGNLTSDLSAEFDGSSNNVLVSYQDSGNRRKQIAGTVSGTSISFGSASSHSSDTYVGFECFAYDSNANKTVLFYRNSSNAKSRVLTVTGTTISYGSPTTISTQNSSVGSAVFDSNSNKLVIGYGYGSSGYVKVGTVSGTSISFGSEVQVPGSGSAGGLAFDSSANKVVVINSDSNDTFNGKAVVGTVSGTSISFGTAVTFDTGILSYVTQSVVYDSNAQKIVTSYSDTNGESTVLDAASLETSLTTENYIGISDGDYSDAATATVQLVGSVDDAQSGLTAGQKYYVQTDGTLATTPDSPEVYAGLAVSSTNLIVKG